MSWIGPAAKNGAKLAVKYGPQAKLAWEKAGRPAMAVASAKAVQQRHRKQAFAKAGVVRDGAVLRVHDHDEPVWIVLSAGEPVDAFPTPTTSLATLLESADRDKAIAFERWDQQRLRRRAGRLRRQSPPAVPAGPRVDVKLTDEERELLGRGLREWRGSAADPVALAGLLGFSSVADLQDRLTELEVSVSDGEALDDEDWRRVLMAVELAFVSGTVGAGAGWSTATGLTDEESVRLLRSAQRRISAHVSD